MDRKTNNLLWEVLLPRGSKKSAEVIVRRFFFKGKKTKGRTEFLRQGFRTLTADKYEEIRQTLWYPDEPF